MFSITLIESTGNDVDKDIRNKSYQMITSDTPTDDSTMLMTPENYSGEACSISLLCNKAILIIVHGTSQA